MATENIPPQVMRRVAKEIMQLTKSPPEGIKVHINEECMTEVQASITGPVGTPYENGVFRMKLVMDASFPTTPPKGWFITKIFHPNVAENGAICVNTLKRDWKPTHGLEHVLTVVKCLLIHPNPASALNEEAGKLLLEQYEDFAAHARMMTDIHAKPSAEDLAEAAAGEEGASSEAAATEKAKKKKAAGKKKAKKSLKRL